MARYVFFHLGARPVVTPDLPSTDAVEAWALGVYGYGTDGSWEDISEDGWTTVRPSPRSGGTRPSIGRSVAPYARVGASARTGTPVRSKCSEGPRCCEGPSLALRTGVAVPIGSQSRGRTGDTTMERRLGFKAESARDP